MNLKMSRDEIIEDRVRHIIPQLERAERLGRHEYVKLSPVDATVLAIVLKEKVAELTMKRYATEKEEAELYAMGQPQVWVGGGGGGVIPAGNPAQNTANYQRALAAQQAAHMKAHQQMMQQIEQQQAAIRATPMLDKLLSKPKKRKLFNW